MQRCSAAKGPTHIRGPRRCVMRQQSSVFQRLYDVAQRRRVRSRRVRDEAERAEHEAEERAAAEAAARRVDPRSLQLAARRRGSGGGGGAIAADIFARLYDEGRRAEARREERRALELAERERREIGVRASAFAPGRKVGPFQPDIGPRALRLSRVGTLLEHLDAEGRRKRTDAERWEAMRQANMMEGAAYDGGATSTIQPNITIDRRPGQTRTRMSRIDDAHARSLHVCTHCACASRHTVMPGGYVPGCACLCDAVAVLYLSPSPY